MSTVLVAIQGDVVDWLKVNPEATSQTILTMPYWQELSTIGATRSEESIWEPPTPRGL